MKRVVLMFTLLAIILSAWSQDVTIDTKSQRELLRQQKKAAKAEESERMGHMVDLMIYRKTFIVEADMIFDRYGNGQNVSSNINFLACDSISGVVQIGSGSYLGRNGLGGITIEGRLSDFKAVKNEKRDYYSITYSIVANTGRYDVSMTASRNGHVDATVRSNWPGSIRYTGNMVYPSKARIYKGTPDF